MPIPIDRTILNTSVTQLINYITEVRELIWNSTAISTAYLATRELKDNTTEETQNKAKEAAIEAFKLSETAEEYSNKISDLLLELENRGTISNDIKEDAEKCISYARSAASSAADVGDKANYFAGIHSSRYVSLMLTRYPYADVTNFMSNYETDSEHDD